MHYRTAKPGARGAPRITTLLSLFVPLLLLAACGGGGGGGASGPAGAPASLAYSQADVMYRTDAPIQANMPAIQGGTPTQYSVAPALAARALPGSGYRSDHGKPDNARSRGGLHRHGEQRPGQCPAGGAHRDPVGPRRKSLAPKASLTDDEVRFFMDRALFGYDATIHADITANGLSSYLDAAIGAINDTATTALETEAAGHIDDLQFPGHTELALWYLHMLQRSSNPLQESLALHWHDHFACSSEVLGTNSRYWFYDHINLWRHNAAGNLRDMAIAMARDWSMLEYLDGRDSRRNQPNENFAREFFELYMLGVDKGYTQEDIVAAAMVFSGYRRTFNGTVDEINWVPGEHSDNDQTVLGVLIPGVDDQPQDEYPTVVDITLAHKGAGDTLGYSSRWLMRSLLRRFCIEDPSDDLIEQLAQILEDDSYDLQRAIKTLFMSEAFYSAQSRAGFIKTPTEHMLGFIRATGMNVQIERANIGFGGEFGLDYMLSTMDNRPTQPPVVDGWPEGTSWLSAQGMVDRANTLEFIISSRDFQENEGFDLGALLPSPTASAQEVVEALCLRLGITPTPEDITTFVDYLNTDDDGSTSADPFDATNATHLDNRVRGLLYILGLHPQYLLR